MSGFKQGWGGLNIDVHASASLSLRYIFQDAELQLCNRGATVVLLRGKTRAAGLDKKYLFHHNRHLEKEIVVFFSPYSFIKTLVSTN